jgi:hypothetical protein
LEYSLAQTVKTGGQVLPNGDLIELVRQAGDDLNVALLHSDGKRSLIAARLELDGTIYEPPDFPPSLLRALRLPIDIQPYGSAATLVKDMATAIAKYTGLFEDLARIVAFSFIATWVFDGVGIAPRLYVVGPQNRGVEQLMKLVRCLARHTVPLAGSAPSALLRLPFELGLTLVFNEPWLTESLRQFLGAAANPNQYVIQGGRLVNPFCPIVLRVERPIGNSAPIAGVEIPIWPTHKEIPFLDSSAEVAITKEFQGKLLGFRLANLHAARESTFDPTDLTSPVRETARSIGACFTGDPDLQAEIISHLRDADAHARILSSTSQEAVIIEAMLFLCHDKNGQNGRGLHVGEIAAAVRVLNRGREETQYPSPRRLGEVLRDLGFKTTRLDKKGRGIVLCRNLDRKVHELAANFGVPSLREGVGSCDGCKSVLEAYGDQEEEG